MARFLFQCVAIVGIFFATLSRHSFADEETASLTDTFHKHPVIVHRKGHTPYLTVDAKLVSVGQTGMVVYLVEPPKDRQGMIGFRSRRLNIFLCMQVLKMPSRTTNCQTTSSRAHASGFRRDGRRRTISPHPSKRVNNDAMHDESPTCGC